MNKSIGQRLVETVGHPFRVTAGFDGFVDTIVKPVKNTDSSGSIYFETIREFGEFLVSKAGKSCSLLLETQQRRLGGNTPIFSQAVARLGQSVTCIGALGNTGIDPVFAGLDCCTRVLSVAEPGQSTALEFDDGKVMLAQNADIDQLDYQRVEQRIGRQQLADSIAAADMVALLNWSELERASDLWRGILNNCLGGILPSDGKRLLVDLCDCSRKNRAQMDELLSILQGFSQHFRVLLSLNQNEAELLGQHFAVSDQSPTELACELRRRVGADTIVIHAIAYACGADGSGAALVPNQNVQKPVTSTGAGDHFNGGLAVGWGHGFALEEMLIIANNTTGYYVSTGTTPTLADLVHRLEESGAYSSLP